MRPNVLCANSGGVSVDSFSKYITFQRASVSGLESLGPVVETLARNEQLDGHAESVTIRIEKIIEAQRESGESQEEEAD